MIWYCFGCGIPRPAWDGKTRCQCGEATATSRRTHGYLHLIYTDGTSEYRSLRNLDWRVDSGGLQLGRTRIGWDSIHAVLTVGQAAR